MRHLVLPTAIVCLVLSTVTIAATKFKTTWNAEDAAGTSFVGKKVVTLVLSDVQTVRMSAEEELARQLATRGIQPIAAYRMIPKELLSEPDQAKAWFERSGVEGVVAMRPIAVDREKVYTPSMWTTSYYTTLWGYYPYAMGATYTAGSERLETTVVIETLIYSVPKNKLLWAGVSETTNPKNLAKGLMELVNEGVKEMKKRGLVKD